MFSNFKKNIAIFLIVLESSLQNYRFTPPWVRLQQFHILLMFCDFANSFFLLLLYNLHYYNIINRIVCYLYFYFSIIDTSINYYYLLNLQNAFIFIQNC